METLPRRYPLGIQTFSEIIEGDYYYVDKTADIYRMTSTYKYVFLSRPRRFGKSLLVSTLASYFRGEKELFKGLAMERLEKQWKKHPVIHLSLASVKEIEPEKIEESLSNRLRDIENQFGIERKSNGLGDRLNDIIQQTTEQYGEKAVVVLDEYDAPLLNVLHDEQRLTQVRQLMRTLYAPLKDCDPYLRFVFITGISKFSQLSIFSEINNLTVISMDDEYATLCGFTQQEIEEYFQDGIKLLAEKEELTVEQTLGKLRQMYDGYHFSSDSPGVYNPYSIINALAKKKIENFWFSTGTPSFLVEMLRKFHTDISRIDGSEAAMEEFDAPTENMKSILPLFYQSGYITIKHFDRKAKLFTLGFPNKEVKTGLMDNLYTYYVAPTLDYRATNIWRISKGLLEDDPETSLQTLQAYLEGIPYQDSRFDENHYTQMLYVIFSLLGLHVDSQVRTAKGRLDVVVRTDGHIYVMEVKLDRPAREAIEQIDSRNYLLPYSLDGRQLTKIGISFSTEERNVTEWIIG